MRKHIVKVLIVLLLLLGIYSLRITLLYNNNILVTNALKQEKVELTSVIEGFIQENTNVIDILNLASLFIRAHTNGEKEELEKLLSDEFRLEERNGDLFLFYEYANEKIQMPLYRSNSNYEFDYYYIKGFDYDIENKTAKAFIREIYIDEQREVASPPTFLKLGFKLINKEWQIISVEFDV
ncbi:hypothetical protein [Alkaliphilus peptidifermentans]|uniref:DUF4829 domain-containing protein n=1 Tax=Alkaliphilus peptidifermentans DSM 18978 TaxID=1120976 RepID=A0A1G5ACN3_9FIRM|nr:hypothetical protein [Alkaliphilus peptidifermentans]SCX75655.1 hypothetical protein SAMN03080606_00060 [Alkaliphilus peptidifermentans DSM 18978]